MPSYTEADVLHWALNVAKALHYLHSRKPMVIHRDLKARRPLLPRRPRIPPPRPRPGNAPRLAPPRPPAPPHAPAQPENILLDTRWNAKVADFGLAKLIPRDPKQTLRELEGSADLAAQADPDEKFEMSAGGSYVFMAPEVFKCERCNEKARGRRRRRGIAPSRRAAPAGGRSWEMTPRLSSPVSSPPSPQVDQFSYSVILWELFARHPVLRDRLRRRRVRCPPIRAAASASSRRVRSRLREWIQSIVLGAVR